MTLEPPQKYPISKCKPMQAKGLHRKNITYKAPASPRKNRVKSPGEGPTRYNATKYRMANAYVYRVLPFDSEVNFRIKPTHRRGSTATGDVIRLNKNNYLGLADIAE